MLSLLWLVAGLALLLVSARWFVAGISAIAAALGVPQLVIAMTVVAFGTSMPELVVNVMSAAQGSTGLAFGNIVGSCIINIGFVLGVTAMYRPLRVEPSLITREIPMMILGVVAFAVFGSDRILDGASTNVWRRTDGIVLLLLFCVFLYYTVRQSISARVDDPFMAEVGEVADKVRIRPGWQDIAMTLVGLAGVSYGADLTVDHAVDLARALGLSETVIGLTVISLGTTLPELATCTMAARRGDSDIALGNVVGSNIFNILCIGGIVATVSPISLPAGGAADLVFLTLQSALLLPIAIRSQRTITRGEGAFFAISFAAYLSWRVIGSL
jgi:cation:H+ antiporter